MYFVTSKWLLLERFKNIIKHRNTMINESLVELVIDEFDVVYAIVEFKSGTLGNEEISRHQTPVRATPLGKPRTLRIPQNQSFPFIKQEVAKIERPKFANSYMVGKPGESYEDGSIPVSVQFYHAFLH